MKTATYKLIDGTSMTVEYDPLAPCIHCNLPVIEASVGGTAVCPWCDTGYNRSGDMVWPPRKATDEEYAMAREVAEHHLAGKIK